MKSRGWIATAFAALFSAACFFFAAAGACFAPDSRESAGSASVGSESRDPEQNYSETFSSESFSSEKDSSEVFSSETDSAQGDEMESYWEKPDDFGIKVNGEGVMTLGGQTLHLAGVNCFNLFNQCFGNYSETMARITLDVLKTHGVKVVRFDCGGYDYSFIDSYYANRTRYVSLLARIAQCAEERQIGLIPSFFWLYHAVPDYYDEPIKAWGRSDSQTVGFLREYTKTIVDALKGYKSIFGWEFGNEFNLSCDLPNVADHLPALPPTSGRASRTEEDYLSATDVSFAFSEFAAVVRASDGAGRMVTSGNASLRPSQYNQLHFNSWEQDTEAEYAEMTAMYTPDGMDTICEHIYFTEQKTFGENLTLAAYLSRLTAMAKNMKKAFFVGEWGGGSSTDYDYYKGIADDFVDAGVQLSLLWNFNVSEGSTEYSFSADSERGRRLLGIVEYMNGRFADEY